MSPLPSVSILIPTYNRAGYVREAIESVARQDYAGPIEVVVVDDGSTDGTADVLQDCIREYPRLRIVPVEIKREPRTPSAAPARNAGLQKVTGDFAGYLDSDDLLEPAKIRRQVEALLAHPEADMCTCMWRWVWDSRPEQADVLGGAKVQSGPLLPGYMEPDGWYVIHSALYRREIVMAAGEWEEDTTWGDDTVWHMKVGLAGAKNIHLPEVLCSVRIHDRVSFQNAKNTDQRAEAEVILFQCHDRIAEWLRQKPDVYILCREHLVDWYHLDMRRCLAYRFQDLARISFLRMLKHEKHLWRRGRIRLDYAYSQLTSGLRFWARTHLLHRCPRLFNGMRRIQLLKRRWIRRFRGRREPETS